MNQELIDLFNLIKENTQMNNIVYETNEGLFAQDIDVFVQKPLEEIMKLLGLDLDSIIARAQENSDRYV
jgi:hypothetical protein